MVDQDMLEQIINSVWSLGGIEWLVLVLFAIFFIDAIIPLLPEMFALLAFLSHPTVAMGCLIIVVAALGDVLGNLSLFHLLRAFGIPQFLKNWITRYTDFLVIKGEKIVLFNRLVPLVPIVGPFIIACGWDLRKTLGYIALGGGIKNTLFFVLAGVFHFMFDQSFARFVSLVTFAVVMMTSFFVAKQRRTSLAS